jgi:hypothetical protein
LNYRCPSCSFETLTQYSQVNLLDVSFSNSDKQFFLAVLVSNPDKQFRSIPKPLIFCGLDFNPIVGKLYFLCRFSFESYHVHSSEPVIGHIRPDVQHSNLEHSNLLEHPSLLKHSNLLKYSASLLKYSTTLVHHLVEHSTNLIESKLFCRLRFGPYLVHTFEFWTSISHIHPDIDHSANVVWVQLFLPVCGFFEYIFCAVISIVQLSITAHNINCRTLPKFFLSSLIQPPVINYAGFFIQQQLPSGNNIIADVNAVFDVLSSHDYDYYTELPERLLKRKCANLDWIRVKRGRSSNCQLLSQFRFPYGGCDAARAFSSTGELRYNLWDSNSGRQCRPQEA